MLLDRFSWAANSADSALCSFVPEKVASAATDRYPAIIAWNGKTCAVTDIMICADKFDINEAHSHKIP